MEELTQARDRVHQAVLPLRGKILNTWEMPTERVLESEVVHDVAVAIGIEPGASDASARRYDRICILADADPDGLHIVSLLVTLFTRHFRTLIEEGHVYVALPPLYRIDAGKEVHYALDEAERRELEAKLAPKIMVQRFKGLGEMNPSQLRETALDPDGRRLVRLALDAEDTEDTEKSTDAHLDRLFAKSRARDRGGVAHAQHGGDTTVSNGKCTARHMARSTWEIVRNEISWLRTATVMLIAITAALIGHHYGPEAHGALYGLQVLAWPASLAAIWLAAERAGSAPPGGMQGTCPGLGALAHWAGAVIYPALVITVAWIANRIAPPGNAEAPEWITTSDLAWMTAASLAAFSLRTTHRVRAPTATQAGGGRLATMTGALVLLIGTWIGATAQSETAAEALGTLERLRSMHGATWGIGPIEVTMHTWWTGAGVAMAGLLAAGIASTAGGASPTRAWIMMLLCIAVVGAGNPHPLSAVMIYAVIAPLIMLAPICAGPAPLGREGAIATWVALTAIVLCAAQALNAVLSNGAIEEIFGSTVLIWAMTAHTACQCRDLLMHRVLVTRWPRERLTGFIWIIWVVCAWGIGTSILWRSGAPAWVAGAIAPPIAAVVDSMHSNETATLEATVREAAIGALASAATLAGLWTWMARRKPQDGERRDRSPANAQSA